MATKQTQPVAKPTDAEKKETGADAPFSGDVKSPDELRKPTVSTPKGTFDERTGVVQPFVTEDGKQDNGQRDLDKVTGAKGGTTREGNTPTAKEVEEK